jgi:hypothetical protein
MYYDVIALTLLSSQSWTGKTANGVVLAQYSTHAILPYVIDHH